MKTLTAIFLTSGILYYLDSVYNGGRYLEALMQIAKHASASVGFYW